MLRFAERKYRWTTSQFEHFWLRCLNRCIQYPHPLHCFNGH